MFSVSTEALLLLLYKLRKTFSKDKGVVIGLTKTIVLYPNSITTVYVKKDDKSFYYILDSRFSNSQREYVLKYFSLLSFALPHTGPNSGTCIHQSPNYTVDIHDKDFLSVIFKKDVDASIEVLKKEFL